MKNILCLLSFCILSLCTLAQQGETVDKLKKENTNIKAENAILNGALLSSNLEVLKSEIYEAYALINLWTVKVSHKESPNKLRASTLIETDIPQKLEAINHTYLDLQLSEESKSEFDALKASIEKFIDECEGVRMALPDFQSYADIMQSFTAQAALDEKITPLFNSIIKDLEAIIKSKK